MISGLPRDLTGIDCLRGHDVPTTPPRGGSGKHWKPVDHLELATELLGVLESEELQPAREFWATARSGMGVVGCLPLRDEFDGAQPLVVLRSSNDGRWRMALSVCALVGNHTGQLVSVLAGWQTVRREKGMTLQDGLAEATRAWAVRFADLLSFRYLLRGLELSPALGDHILMVAARERVIPWQLVRTISHAWNDCPTWTAWDLYLAMSLASSEQRKAGEHFNMLRQLFRFWCARLWKSLPGEPPSGARPEMRAAKTAREIWASSGLQLLVHAPDRQVFGKHPFPGWLSLEQQTLAVEASLRLMDRQPMSGMQWAAAVSIAMEFEGFLGKAPGHPTPPAQLLPKNPTGEYEFAFDGDEENPKQPRKVHLVQKFQPQESDKKNQPGDE